MTARCDTHSVRVPCGACRADEIALDEAADYFAASQPTPEQIEAHQRGAALVRATLRSIQAHKENR